MKRFIPRLDAKEKSFHGLLAVGGLAGIIEGSIRYGFTLHTAFPGMLLTLLGAFLGGFTGFFVKDCFRAWRGLKPYRGVNNDGWMLGGFLGSFVGALFQVAASPDGANLVIGSIAGAFFGAAGGALPDEFITPILGRMAERTPDRS
ncbi:hypothetical protein LF599_11810 [Pseudodesulfovibrio thermohalotolerans]|uniref:hypothetical protein n=1 Tax=Pseudodesulfovibrio thermohalotolerans TaxID=2880651 RepID=UPI002442958E|nr:hypothetical protein [Pseudodesulfovibrio thermohalotolerans]WFS61358.1 hypothetical protein LF599_11810 [Pseudodesulfovibrio thermohalotolerans]